MVNHTFSEIKTYEDSYRALYPTLRVILTHWGQDKMTDIFVDIIFICNFFRELIWFIEWEWLGKALPVSVMA